MKKQVKVSVVTGLLVVLCAAAGLSARAHAADVTAGTDLASAYVWRGITFNDGLVAQPSVDVTSGGFGFNVWSNMDIDDYDDTLNSGEFSEVDLTLSYGFSLDPVDVSVGYIEYLFPEGGSGTRELYADLSIEPLSGLTAGVTGYYDFDEVEDYYVNVSLGYAYELAKDLTLGAGAEVGVAGDDASAGEDSGFHEYLLSVDCAWALTEALEVTAYMAYTDNFDKDVLPDQDTDWFGGMGVYYSF